MKFFKKIGIAALKSEGRIELSSSFMHVECV